MGFPNVDKFLVKTFISRFKSAQADGLTVDDLFDDLDAGERNDIKRYLTNLTVSGNVQDKGDRYLYILPHFPMTEIPFPQIGISLGTDDTAEKVIGDYTGEAKEVKDGQGNVIAHDLEKGYWSAAVWNIDVVTDYKDDAIWLSRLCQRFICESLDDLDGIGVKEVGVSLADIRLDNQLTQTSGIFNRSLRVTAKVANTWHKRIPVSTYASGVNSGLE